MIAEISLYSFGFTSSRALSKKLTATFKLSSEQLSSQDHYDYGMRAVKTVITRAGYLKRADPNMNEEILLLRALRDVNVPKFLKEDLPLFEGIISDLFPEIKRPEIDYGTLMDSIVASTIKCGLVPVCASFLLCCSLCFLCSASLCSFSFHSFSPMQTEHFLLKCIQLYETTVVRHGLMLVGPTGGGKSSNIRVLKTAISTLNEQGVGQFQKVVTKVINPKAITMGQLCMFLFLFSLILTSPAL